MLRALASFKAGDTLHGTDHKQQQRRTSEEDDFRVSAGLVTCEKSRKLESWLGALPQITQNRLAGVLVERSRCCTCLRATPRLSRVTRVMLMNQLIGEPAKHLHIRQTQLHVTRTPDGIVIAYNTASDHPVRNQAIGLHHPCILQAKGSHNSLPK